jgi:2,4-dienoyl-CoA reductase-like NADH-dependent reductase (Old Yellow Enzyme family)/thioredoxin reductase
MSLNRYPHVYSPIEVGNMTLKNRIQYSPIVTNHAGYRSGSVTNELLEFVSAQAGTGAGLVTIGSTPVNFKEARDFFGCLSVTSDDDLPGLSHLSAEVHRYGCKLSAELIHGGQWGVNTLPEGERAWVPSVVAPHHDPKRFREISRADMLSVIDDFIASLKRCMLAGFDMAMIHYAHGNLMSGFLSTAWNKRNDAYGGSEKNRWRFPLELLEAARGVTQGKIPLEMRIVGNEYIPDGTPLDERIRFLKEAQKYIDMIVVSAGTLAYGEAVSYNMPGYYAPACLNVPYAAAFKEACPDLVVSVVGGISTLDEAEDIIQSGKADIAAMAKALMADGAFVTKGLQGREADIRPCMRCLYCLRQANAGMHPDGCAVNPTLGWEYRTPKPALAPKKKKVMIIGGGPAGMASAQYLTERGHTVVLYEKADKLGGRLFEASALSYKDGFRRYFDYTVRKTNACGAKIILGTQADAESIRAEAPDALIIAVGAKAVVPPIPGIDGPNVVGVSEADRGEAQTGNRVVVCGAGLSGAECALSLATEGKTVTLVDRIPEEAFCADLIFFAKPLLFKLLAEKGVTCLGDRIVRAFEPDGVVVEKADGGTEKLACDTAVIAFGIAPDPARTDALADVVPETYIVGDADKTGVIGDAIGQAYWFCKDI